jgi:hypothetical protein
MMKRILAAALTVILIGTVLWMGRNRPDAATGAGTPTPDACIQRMFDAASRGDVDGYLACFTGDELQRLQRQLNEEPRESFARSLTEAVAALKGRAVFQNGTAEPNATQSRFTVDRIYPSRTERQRYRLVRERDGWRIHSVENASAFQPDKPYGTPVFE